MAIYREKNSIGEYLRIQLTKKGISITQLASDLGLSRGLVQKYISNTKHPTDSTLERIAEYFDLPVSYFKGESFFDINEIINNVPIRLNEKNISIDTENKYKQQISWINAYYEFLSKEEKIEFLLRLNAFVQNEKGILLDKKHKSELEEPVTRERVEQWNLTRYLIQLEDVSFEWICKLIEEISNKQYNIAIGTIDEITDILKTRDSSAYIPVNSQSDEAMNNLNSRSEAISSLMDSLTGLQIQEFEPLGYIIVNLTKDDQKLLSYYLEQLKVVLNNKKD